MYSSYSDAAVFANILMMLLIFCIPGIICGNMCKRLSALKRLPYPYFWTGFFLSILGLLYVGFVSLNTPAPATAQAPENPEKPE